MYLYDVILLAYAHFGLVQVNLNFLADIFADIPLIFLLTLCVCVIIRLGSCCFGEVG